MSIILEKIYVGSWTGSGYGSETSWKIRVRKRIRIWKKIIPNSRHLFRSYDRTELTIFLYFIGLGQSRAPDSCTRRLEPWRSWSRDSSSPALPGSSPASRPPPSLSVSPAHFFFSAHRQFFGSRLIQSQAFFCIRIQAHVYSEHIDF